VSYQIEYNDDLSASNWTRMNDPFIGTGGSLNVTNSYDTSDQRFFRLRIGP
jgi:hypothetical protein